MLEAVIKIDNLTKEFGEITAVNNVSLTIIKGELFGLLGPNGSGKTTMIKTLTGQIKPTKGSAEILGVNVIKNPIKVRELAGIIPEQETPPSFLTAEEYLQFVSKIRRISSFEKKLIVGLNF